MLGVNTPCGAIISISPLSLSYTLIIHAFGHFAVVFVPSEPVDQLNLAHFWYLELMREFFFFFLQPLKGKGILMTNVSCALGS